MHDQNFKNLILDYPVQSLEFFAGKEAGSDLSEARIIPHSSGTTERAAGGPVSGTGYTAFGGMAGRPAGSLAHYCLDLAELMKTDRVIPVVIFLRRGNHQRELRLGSDTNTWLEFRYLACHLWSLSAKQYYESANIFARLNLPNMAYAGDYCLNRLTDTIAFKIKILGALSVGDGREGLSPPCCLPKIINLKAIIVFQICNLRFCGM